MDLQKHPCTREEGTIKRAGRIESHYRVSDYAGSGYPGLEVEWMGGVRCYLEGNNVSKDAEILLEPNFATYLK